RNPLDMIASATPAGYTAAMRAMMSDPGVDAVVPIFVPPFGVKQEDVAEAIVGAMSGDHSKAVLAVLIGREGLPAGRAELQEAHIPTYIFPESAARALASLNRHVEWTARPSAGGLRSSGVDRDAARAIIQRAASEHREHLSQAESLDLVGAYGVRVAASRVARSAAEAMCVAREIGYPVA